MSLKIGSLFCGGGVGESRLNELGCKTIVANEIREDRCNFFQSIHPNAEVLSGSITDTHVQKKFIRIAKENQLDVIMATPPCQGMSLVGRVSEDDPRNFLIYYAIKVIKSILPRFVLLENVPRQLTTRIKVKNKKILIPDYILQQLSRYYYFNPENLIKAMDYGIPQMRPRNIMLLTRRDEKKFWHFPPKKNHIVTLKEAIGHFPSLDPQLREGMAETLAMFPHFKRKAAKGRKFSSWHIPPIHPKKDVIAMQKTPTGQTAFDNAIFFPKRHDGKPMSGHSNHFRRMRWDKPSRTLTQNNGVMSSLACVHPGKTLRAGDESSRLYSDPRSFSIKELFTIFSINFENKVDPNTSQVFLRRIAGEGIPPLLVKELFNSIVR